MAAAAGVQQVNVVRVQQMAYRQMVAVINNVDQHGHSSRILATTEQRSVPARIPL